MDEAVVNKSKLPESFTTVTPLSKYLAMALFVIFPFVGFYLGIQYQKMAGSSEANLEVIATPAPKTEKEANIPQNFEPTVYKFSFELNSGSYLVAPEVYKLIADSNDYWLEGYRDGFPGIYFDVASGRTVGDLVSGPFEGVEFYLLSGWDLEVGKTYSNDLYSVTILSEHSDLVPYLENNDYCEQDSDCSIRYDWCEKGGWNNFTSYHEGRGCQFGGNEGQPDGIEAELGCEELPASKGIIAQYSSVSCINNSCVADNPSFTCAESTQTWIDDGGGL